MRELTKLLDESDPDTPNFGPAADDPSTAGPSEAERAETAARRRQAGKQRRNQRRQK